MPYKCSVKGCRSNYDSTSEKVSVFQFPADNEQKVEWLQNIELNSKLTNSSRVCIKHFELNDIEISNRRSLLKPLAAPVNSRSFEPTMDLKAKIKSEIKSEILEAYDVPDEVNESDIIHGFAQFCLGLEEIQASFIENWNIYNQLDGVCFYRLSSNDQSFNDINFSFKILINKHMRVKLYSNENEASCEELKWVLTDCQLQTWSQLDSILVNYQQEPEVVMTIKPLKYLTRAFESLSQVRRIELQSKIDSVKEQIVSIHRMAELLPDLQEEDFYLKPPVEEVAFEAAQDDPSCEEAYEEEFLEHESTQEEENSLLKPELTKQLSSVPNEDPIEPEENLDAVIDTDDDEPLIEYENPLKCENCFITLQSENGFRAHQKSCNTPITNVRINTRISKLPKTVKPPKSEMNVCDNCGKSFRTMKNLKEHMKLHNDAHRQKCPLCDVILFTGVMQRHIRAVHSKLKPHACLICSKSFSTSTLRNDHEKTHSRNLDIQQYLVVVDGSARYACPKCPTSYETSTLLKKHIEMNCRLAQKKRVYRYPCIECAKNFTTKIQAAQHLLSAHKTEIKNLEKYCFECNDEFDDYVNHVRFHSCNFACRFCGSKFLTQEKALSHEKNKHSKETTEDRPFKCKEKNCSLSFKNVNHLRSHQQAIHTQQQLEFQCSHCDKKFGLRAHLTVHVRQHYASFPCNFPDCDRRFKKLNNLKGHLEREHGVTEIYLCNCGARFKMLNLLKNHSENDHGVAFNIHKYFENQ